MIKHIGNLGLRNDEYNEYKLFVEQISQSTEKYFIKDICYIEIIKSNISPFIRIKDIICLKPENGFISVILCFLVMRLGYKLFANNKMSNIERSFWEFISRYRTLKMIDMITTDLSLITEKIDFNQDLTKYSYVFTFDQYYQIGLLSSIEEYDIWVKDSVFGQQKESVLIEYGKGMP